MVIVVEHAIGDVQDIKSNTSYDTEIFPSKSPDVD